MRRVALGLGLIAASAAAAAASGEVEASSASAAATTRTTNNNIKSSLRARRTPVGAEANGQHKDTMDLMRPKGMTMTVAVGEGADGPGATASTMQDSTRKRRTTTKKKKVITKRGLHRSQIEADALDDEEYWDRFLTEDSSIVPTPPPTRRPTPNPTPPPTPGPTPPPTPGPTPGPTPPPTPGPTPAPTPGPTLAPTPRPTTAAPTTPAPTFTCNFSPEDRAIAIADILRQVSNPIDFVAPFSPQSRSLKWITEDDSLYLCPDDPFLIQRYTMAVFYFSTDGPNWVECSAPADLSDPNSIREANANCNLEVEIGQGGTDAWLTPVSECQWGGVACDTVSSDMERIEFEKNNLAGTIPRELQELQELRFLHMEEGRTGGTIPPELGNLSNLLELDMNFNALTGSIPANMYNLANLLEFDMNDNSLSGPISPDIQKMTKLTFLQFHRNQFTGSIPAEVGNLNRLIVATFDTNFLQDPMPEEVCLLRAGNLRTLTSDCLDPADPFYVECSTPCCTQCF